VVIHTISLVASVFNIKNQVAYTLSVDFQRYYPLFEEKVGIVLLDGSEVGGESELSLRFEVS